MKESLYAKTDKVTGNRFFQHVQPLFPRTLARQWCTLLSQTVFRQPRNYLGKMKGRVEGRQNEREYLSVGVQKYSISLKKSYRLPLQAGGLVVG